MIDCVYPVLLYGNPCGRCTACQGSYKRFCIPVVVEWSAMH